MLSLTTLLQSLHTISSHYCNPCITILSKQESELRHSDISEQHEMLREKHDSTAVDLESTRRDASSMRRQVRSATQHRLTFFVFFCFVLCALYNTM
jgi:hypothetical protein